jgi:hypothetical protein
MHRFNLISLILWEGHQLVIINYRFKMIKYVIVKSRNEPTKKNYYLGKFGVHYSFHLCFIVRHLDIVRYFIFSLLYCETSRRSLKKEGVYVNPFLARTSCNLFFEDTYVQVIHFIIWLTSLLMDFDDETMDYYVKCYVIYI